MNAHERVAYDAWVTANRNRYGTALMNAFLAGYRAGRTAEPAWDHLTLGEQLDHIESCWGTCVECADHRAWGICTSCGDVKEALPPLGLSRCCGSPVALTPASPDNLMEERA